MKKILLLLFFYSSSIFAQNSIKGTIVDVKTDEVLPFASVYIGSTTKGTQTDEKGEFSIQNIPSGKIQLVVSYVGYQPFSQTILVENNKEITLKIKLTAAENFLSEVQIKAKKKDKEWNRYIRDFRMQLLGDSPNMAQCKILNEWTVEFEESSIDNTLRAKSSRPIEIENRALGYKLYYDLRQFSLTKSTFKMSGTTRFENLTPSNQKEASRWEDRRKETFLLSTRNFFKSLINGNLETNGFVVYQTGIKGSASMTSVTPSYRVGSNMVTDASASSLLAVGSKTGEALLFLESPIEVTNTKRYVAMGNASSNPVSIIRQLKPKVEITTDGWLYDPTALEIQGYWANERVADMLPREYGQENEPIVVQKQSLPMVYLHINKSGFTAGEKIWFSAYLTNRETKGLITEQQPLYVEIYAPEGDKIAAEKIFTSNGRGFGNILLPLKQLSGVYRIRAFTKPMLNDKQSIFEKEIIVQNIQEKVLVIRNEKKIEQNLDNSLKINVSTNTESFKTREKVEIKIKVLTVNDKPVQGTFSLAVVDAKGGVQNKDDFDMVSYMSQKKEFKETKGNFALENTMVLSGTAINKRTKMPIENAEVLMIVIDTTAKSTSRIAKTDTKGRFVINDLEIVGSKNISFQVNNKKGKADIEGTLIFDEANPNEKLPEITFQKVPMPEEKRMELLMNIQKHDGEEFRISESDILLDEVLIKETKKEKDPNEVGVIKLYSEPTHSVSFDENAPRFADIYDMMAGTLPGVSVSSSGDGTKIVRVRGIGTINSNSPLFVVDGTPTEDPSFVNPNDVARIDVISDGMAGGMYGMRSANGVILLYTRRFRTRFNNLVYTKSMMIKGLQEDMPFYSPNYLNPKSEHKDPDRRFTLYWNPEIITDEKGEASVSFYAADLPTEYKIVVEGLTSGNMGHAEKQIKINQ